MFRVAVIGDKDSIYGFAAVGLDTFPVNSRDDAIDKLKLVVSGEYAVVYITEDLAFKLADEIGRYYDQEGAPAIIPIPGITGNRGIGMRSLSKFVEQAVGSDIIFGQG